MAVFSDYKISNSKEIRYIFIIIDNFSNYAVGHTTKNQKLSYNNKRVFKNFNNIKTKPLKLESDRAAKFYNTVFQNFLKLKIINHYSRFSDKGPSIAERVIRTIGNLIKKTSLRKR